jgi:hypothetical protein
MPYVVVLRQTGTLELYSRRQGHRILLRALVAAISSGGEPQSPRDQFAARVLIFQLDHIEQGESAWLCVPPY